MHQQSDVPKTLSGKSLVSTIRTMAALGPLGQEVLDAYGITEVDPNAWYPFNLRRDIHQIAFERFGKEALFNFGLNNAEHYQEAQNAFSKSAVTYEKIIKDRGEEAHSQALLQLLKDFAATHTAAIRITMLGATEELGAWLVPLQNNVFEYHMNTRAELRHEAFNHGLLTSGFTRWLGKYWSHTIELLPELLSEHEAFNHFAWRVSFTRQDNLKSGVELVSELQFKAREALMAKVLADAEAQRRLARKAMDDLESAHRLVLDSIRYASLLQQAQLPRPERLENRFQEVAVHWEPRDTIGGDLWWISPSSQQDRFTVCVVDCSGHGVPGAMLALLASTSLERIYGNEPDMSPAKALLQLSQALRRGLNQDQTQNSDSALQNDGCDAAFVQVDRQAGTLRFAGANVDLIWMPQEGAVQRLHADSVGLGYREADPHQISERTLRFESGDRFWITTDGFVDQVGAQDVTQRQRAFGYRRLMQLLTHNRALSLQENIQVLRDHLSLWQAGGLRRDDITLLAVQLQS